MKCLVGRTQEFVCNNQPLNILCGLPAKLYSRVVSCCNQSVLCGYRVFKDYKAPSGHIMQELVPETLSHLTQVHLEYFSKWSKLLLIESSVEAKWKTIRELWTKPAEER